MDHESLTVMLSRPMILALQRIAVVEDVTVGQVIRNAISRDLSRREKAKTPVRVDERLVAPWRALLADDFAYAENWGELQDRLSRKGYALAEAGGRLILQSRSTGERLCKGSELGCGYSSLLRRFKMPFPGHGHRWFPGRACTDALPPEH
ncbi:MAG: hypothetical protein U1D06_13575 [Paracoccaceae bacterium]|nr:hypothetical protein [Paracoccaceae bacterium]